MICSPQISGVQIKKHELGRKADSYVGEDRCMQGFCRGKIRERDSLEKISVNGILMLKEVLWKYFGRRGLH
jgi:hypothetical protein